MKMIKMTKSRWENQIVKTNGEIRKYYVSIQLKSYHLEEKKIVNIGTPPLHLDLWGKMFYVHVSKMFLFPLVVDEFHIAQKLQNPNFQCRYGHQDNSKGEIVSEELTSYLF